MFAHEEFGTWNSRRRGRLGSVIVRCVSRVGIAHKEGEYHEPRQSVFRQRLRDDLRTSDPESPVQDDMSVLTVNQRHVHLPAPAMMLAHVVLHDRVPAGKAVLVAKTIEDAARRVPLLAMVVVAVPAQPLVDESGEPIELRTAHRRGAPVSRRHRGLDVSRCLDLTGICDVSQIPV